MSLESTTVQRKYAEERAKRLRSDGNAQFVNIKQSNLKHLADDPWADHKMLNAVPSVLHDGDRVPLLIVGTGILGIHIAVRLVQAGIPAADIRFVDDGTGFGGTWYWNRYPGLMSDAESYIYEPLLEETGFMPKHKYAYGTELREQIERAATQFGLHGNAQWRTRVRDATWNEDAREWTVSMLEHRGPDEQERNLSVRAHLFILTGGGLNTPRLPRIPGLEEFRGEIFHTARWNYDVTGGSQADPSMTLLKDKVVGIVGTGVTGVQVVPELAKWAKHLYVFQRTPAGVDVRGQRATDPTDWETKIATSPGWQTARQESFVKFMGCEQLPDDVDLVQDRWTRMRTGMAIFGGRGPHGNVLSPEQIPAHVAAMYEADIERMEQVRARVDEEVKDPQTAAKLKAWYASWCKRPTFNDHYLATFNKPNVTLVDTDGKGCSGLTQRGVLDANTGAEYPVDILVFSTGYRPMFGLSPADVTEIKVLGRDGLDMADVWRTRGAHTLHGIATPGFPNMFFYALGQTALSVNFTYATDLAAKHITYIISEGFKRAVDLPLRLEVTRDAADTWTQQVVERAGFFSVMTGCTPGFINNEGELLRSSSAEDDERIARNALWSEGPLSFSKILTEWRAEGDLKGFIM